MEVERAPVMGPERVLPNSEEDDALQDRPLDTAVSEEWSGEDPEEDEEGEPGEPDTAGYYYQPLNQDPDGMNGLHMEPGAEGSAAEEIQEVQDRIQAMGLFLPQPPLPDSDDEEDLQGAVARTSHASIPMDDGERIHSHLVKRTMAAVNLPSLGIPSWAREISDDQWKDMVQKTLQSRQSSAGLRLERK
ncbi:hypothetical protein DNTS_010956 [Danionella cerebrum]|uniref:Male-enhanced antigen 1 n=1 Tax=Danionella cerebrum TaxID=2873325 RepID=A0A553QZK0_9TELE|nr:hypothetical protein DNTS_010956 [Danionella translucida]